MAGHRRFADREDDLAGVDRVAQRHLHGGHRALDRGRHIERRLLRLDLNDRLLERERITFGDVDLGHVRFVDVLAEVGQEEVSGHEHPWRGSGASDQA